MNERQATKTAGELAGLNVLNIINEPTAAAISYGVSGNDKDETVLVYDLGGGTFDITVMRIAGNDISVVCTGGDDQLGGKDWDEALMEYVTERYEEENGEDLSEDPETVAALYVDVETWKKSLTSREKINISVNGPAGRFREELTREKYDELTGDLLNRTKNLLDDVLAIAEKQGYPISRIDKVLLVGGSSRMPQVAEMLERDYHVTPILSDPDEAVAKGASIYASNEKAYKLNIANVLSRTYGISAYEDDYCTVLRITNMLMINDKLPASATQSFYTVSNNQSMMDIDIYESRSTDRIMDIDDKEPITVIDMKFKKPVPKETEVVITFSLDNSGILHIVAEEQLYHSKLDTTFQLSNQMSDDEMRSAALRMSSANVE
jgi:molecular chaperone DnaK (HSP70)